MGSWNCYVMCGLCSARTPYFSDNSADVAHSQAHDAARVLGFVELPAVIEAERRRFVGYVCAECCADVAKAKESS